MALSFDELFAIRIQLQDYTTDEFSIIKRLKIMLLDSGLDNDEINEYLVDFYNQFGIEITLEQISQINISNLSFYNVNIPIQQPINLPEIQEEESNENSSEEASDENLNENNSMFQNMNNIINNVSNINNIDNLNNLENIENLVATENLLPQEFTMFTNIISNIINQYQHPPQENNDNEDVIVTLDDDCLENLPIEKAGDEKYDRCTICLMDIVKDEEITKLKCNHYFHTECIKDYLKDFDYKCPICRDEIGKTKAHLQ